MFCANSDVEVQSLPELKHDLAARLVLRLEVPNLDARREDIPLLVRHLLRHAAEKNPKATRPFRAPSDDKSFELQIKSSLIEHLLRHRYTTNIRELDALLWRAMSTSTGDAIEWPDVAAKSPANREDVREEKPTAQGTPKELDRGDVATPIETSQSVKVGETSPSNEAVETTLPTEAQIRGALTEHEGNIAGAARALGLSSRYVLYRLMRKYRIEVR